MQNGNSIYFLFLIAMSQLTYAMTNYSETSLSIKCEILDCNQELQYLEDLESHLRHIHSMNTSTLRMDLGEELIALLKAPSLEQHCSIDCNDDSENLIYRCKIENCDKVYTHINYLKRHLLTHSEERPFRCDKCGKGFKFDAHLKGHAKVHQNDYPYSCDICEGTFKRASDLNKHMKEIHIHIQKHPRKRSIR